MSVIKMLIFITIIFFSISIVRLDDFKDQSVIDSVIKLGDRYKLIKVIEKNKSKLFITDMSSMEMKELVNFRLYRYLVIIETNDEKIYYLILFNYCFCKKK